MKATEDFLANLHGELATAMKRKLQSGDFTASDLNVIRQFLKDNGINADGSKDETLRGLADDLPEDIDNVVPLYGS